MLSVISPVASVPTIPLSDSLGIMVSMGLVLGTVVADSEGTVAGTLVSGIMGVVFRVGNAGPSFPPPGVQPQPVNRETVGTTTDRKMQYFFMMNLLN